MVESPGTQPASLTATGPRRVPMASVMPTLMPTDTVMAMALPHTQPESPTATDHHRAPTESVTLRLMPMVMAMVMESPVTGEVVSPTATDPHRVLASVMLMPTAMDMAMELPRTQLEFLIATDHHRAPMASVMLR